MEAMVEPWPRRDTERRSSLADSCISIRAERKSGPSSSDSSKNSIHDHEPRDGPDSVFQAQATFDTQDDWPNNQTLPNEASAPPSAPGFVDEGEKAAVILVDEGGDWSPTAELDFEFDTNQQEDIRRSPNQEHKQKEDGWWKSPTPTPAEIDVDQDRMYSQPVEEEQELQLQLELLQELSTPMPPMPMSLSTPTETSPSKSFESMRMSTTETSPPPKSWESVPTPSDPAFQELFDSLKLQLEKSEMERDRYKKECEDQQKKEYEIMMKSLNPDNIRELYTLRKDYAKLQRHSIELMERSEASEKDTEKRAMVLRKFRQLEEEARIQVEEMRSEMAKLRLEKNTMYEENRIARDDREWWKAEHDKQGIIIENGRESLAELRKMYTERERDLEAKHEENIQKIREENENRTAQIDQTAQKALEEEYEAKVAKMKARHNENLSNLQTRIATLEKTNSNYDSVLSTLTRFLSVEASKRNIKFDYEKGSRYKGFQGKPYANLHKTQNIMNLILKELDSKPEHPEHDCIKCPSKGELAQAGADSRITMLEQFVAREATERGINVSGDASTMVHSILNELDVTREELIRCKLSRHKYDKCVGAVTETSDKGVSTVTEDDFPPSIDEPQSASEDDIPPSIGDPQPVTVVIVIEVTEAFLQIVESTPSLAPLKVELERLRARVPDECEIFRPPERLPAITMETRLDDDQWRLEFNGTRQWSMEFDGDLVLYLAIMVYIAVYFFLFVYEQLAM